MRSISTMPRARSRSATRCLRDGDWISIDGFTGEVVAGQVATKPSEVVQVLIDKSLKPEQSKVYQQFAELMSWVDGVRKLRVRTNADKPNEATVAVAFGAEGIGLCRTEHMFFEGDRIDAMREMILATALDARKKALDKLLPLPARDFEGLFQAMQGRPVTIRLLDPPLHEFLPHQPDQQKELSWPRSAYPSRRSRAACKSCMKPTRCSGTAAAGWASSIRRSPRCRPGDLRSRLHGPEGAARRSSRKS